MHHLGIQQLYSFLGNFDFRRLHELLELLLVQHPASVRVGRQKHVVQVIHQLLLGHLQRGQLVAALQFVIEVLHAEFVNVLRLIPQDFAHEILQDSRELCGDLVISLILGGHFTRGDLQKHKLSAVRPAIAAFNRWTKQVQQQQRARNAANCCCVGPNGAVI